MGLLAFFLLVLPYQILRKPSYSDTSEELVDQIVFPDANEKIMPILTF